MFSLSSPLFPSTTSSSTTTTTTTTTSTSRHGNRRHHTRRTPPTSAGAANGAVVAAFEQSNWESVSYLRFNIESGHTAPTDDDDDYDAYVRRQAQLQSSSSSSSTTTTSTTVVATSSDVAAPAVNLSVADSMAITRHAKRGNPLRSAEYAQSGFSLVTGNRLAATAAPNAAVATAGDESGASPARVDLFRTAADSFVRLPTVESAALLMAFPQSVFDQIVLGLNPKPLRLVCRRWLSMFRSLRVHWLADSADRAIEAQFPRLESLVMLDLSHTNVSSVGLATITRSAASLAFLDLAHCIGLNDAAVTCDLLAQATRLRQIDLTGIAIAPPADAIVALTRITRLQRLAWHDGAREFFVHFPSTQPLPSFDAVKALLEACPTLRIQFKSDITHSAAIAEVAAVQAPNSRMSFVPPHALKVLQRWPSCTACARPCYLTRIDAETRQPLKCDICNAWPVGNDHIVCMQHTPKIVHCKFCHDASSQ